MIPIQTMRFAAPVSVAAVFTQASRPPPNTRSNGALHTPANGTPHRVPGSAAASIRSAKIGKDENIQEIRYVDYRYYRFLLHPKTGLFRLARDWTDPIWTSALNLRRGVTEPQRALRSQLFGSNVISIEARTVGQILVDECLHPFCTPWRRRTFV